MEVLRAQLEKVNSSLQKLQKETAEAKEALLLCQNSSEEEIKRITEAKDSEILKYKFCLETFANDDDSICFYTGFQSYKHFMLFYNLIKPSAETMTYYYASGARDSRPDSRCMQTIDELFMFLVRIKLNLMEQDIADRFQVNIATISCKMITWANYLYFLLGSQPIWPIKQSIDANMPSIFQESTVKTFAIL